MTFYVPALCMNLAQYETHLNENPSPPYFDNPHFRPWYWWNYTKIILVAFSKGK